MYKPFSKAAPVVKPNAWENAVYHYVTCPLSAQAPAPQTRIDQLAQAFVNNEKAATDIRYIKEISRCITISENYAAYKEDPNGFGSGLSPIEIKVGFGKPEDIHPQASNAETPADSVTGQPSMQADITPSGAGDPVRPAQLPTEPSTPFKHTKEQASFMQQVHQLRMETPHTAQEAAALYKGLLSLTNTAVYRSLSQSDRGQVKAGLKLLKEQQNQLEEHEAQKLQKEGYEKASLGLASQNYEDPAKDYRTEPQDPVAYLNNEEEDLPSEDEIQAQIQATLDKYPDGVPPFIYDEQIFPLSQKLRRRQALNRDR